MLLNIEYITRINYVPINLCCYHVVSVVWSIYCHWSLVILFGIFSLRNNISCSRLQTFALLWIFYSFFLDDSPASECYVPTFRHIKFRGQRITQKKESNISCFVCSQREIQDPRMVQQIAKFSGIIYKFSVQLSRSQTSWVWNLLCCYSNDC